MFKKLKALMAGWSIKILSGKIAGRAAPVAVAAAVGFFGKWAPETASDPDKVNAALTVVVWGVLEALRNAVKYGVNSYLEGQS